MHRQPHTEETRRKISEAMKGRKRDAPSPETRAKISVSLKRHYEIYGRHYVPSRRVSLDTYELAKRYLGTEVHDLARSIIEDYER